jgi:adenylylsulfate kinase-like enzyme
VSAPYEAPEHPELRIGTAEVSVDEAVDAVLERLRAGGLLPPSRVA